MKTLLFSVLLFTSSALTAQYADLLKNPDITWIGEHTTDFNFCPNDGGKNKPNSATLVKFSNTKAHSGFYSNGSADLCNWLDERLVADLPNGIYECFDDERLTRKLSREALIDRVTQTDTIVAFDPETYAETTRFVRNSLDFEKVEAWRARMVYYFDNKTKTFGARLLAFAPVVAGSPIVWAKAPVQPGSFDDFLQSGDVAYAMETKMLGNAPASSDFSIKKGQSEIRRMLFDVTANPSSVCLSGSNFQPISRSQLDKMINSRDTVVTYDPATRQEKTQIVGHALSAEGISSVRFVHLWFYNEKSRQLCCRLTGVAPMVDVRNTEGVFRFRKPVYYLVCK